MSAAWSPEQLVSLYRDMYLIRRFEERLLALSQRGLLRTGWNPLL